MYFQRDASKKPSTVSQARRQKLGTFGNVSLRCYIKLYLWLLTPLENTCPEVNGYFIALQVKLGVNLCEKFSPSTTFNIRHVAFRYHSAEYFVKGGCVLEGIKNHALHRKAAEIDEIEKYADIIS